MSNTIAHLAVAREILLQSPALVTDAHAYYLGTLAPDTISSKPGCLREDKKYVHLRQDIRDADWLTEEKMSLFQSRIAEFAENHIQNNPDSARRDFAVGYLVHLLTDKWNHKTIRQQMLRIANGVGVQETDRAFFHMMTNDLEALDQYLLTRNPQLRQLFADLTGTPVTVSLPGYIETEYLQASIQWWQTTYLPNIQARKLLYISTPDIDTFVELSSREILRELLPLL